MVTHTLLMRLLELTLGAGFDLALIFGGLDTADTKTMACTILEGGDKAFLHRKDLYGLKLGSLQQQFEILGASESYALDINAFLARHLRRHTLKFPAVIIVYTCNLFIAKE